MPVCITGMHRSGTSMVAHALSLCGLDLGPTDQLLSPDDWNADGYWENRKLVELDDWMLEQLGGSWDLPPATVADAELRRSFVVAAHMAVAEIGFGEPWAWKDPRVCLLADLWRDAVSDIRFVVVVRNPVEVALSLQRRGATSARLGLSLWSTYYSELLARVPPSDRVVVTYDAFLGDPSGAVDRLADRLGLDADSAQRQLAVSAVDVRLRHHATDPAGLPGHVVDLYEALRAEARDGAPAEPPPATPKPSRPASGASELTTLFVAYQERDALRGHVEGLTADRDNWRERSDDLTTEVVQREVELDRLRAEVAADREAWNAEAARLAEEASAWQVQAGRLEQDRDNWQREARNWRSETERLVNAEQSRLRWRVRRKALRVARRVWWAAPAWLRDRLRPILFAAAHKPAARHSGEDAPEELPPAPARTVRVAPRPAVADVEVPISVVVPTWNAGSDGALFLAALERQAGVRDIELVVADSGSTDGTRELMVAAGATLIDVPPGEFGHGKTRNDAFGASSGEVVVMMVQDAILLGRHALRDLVHELLADDRVAAVSARQSPRSHADLYAAYNVVTHHRAVWRDGRSGAGGEGLRRRAAAAVDDVCAAIRRSVWEGGLQYRDVEFGEDLDFGLRAAEAGWTIGLSDAVCVAHSHNRDAVYQFRRSIADRLNIAPLVGDDHVARSAGRGSTDEIVAAGRPLLHQLEAALALSGANERLSDRLRRVTELLASASPVAAPPTGELAQLDAYFGETGSGDADDEIVGALRREMANLLGWPYLAEFATAQRGTTDADVNSFVAKLAGSVVGRSVGDCLRVKDSPADRKRLLVGV